MVQICDIIAVKVLKNNQVFVGIGNNVRYYSNVTYKEVPWRIKRKIHGIDVDDENDVVLVYGERQFILFSNERNDFKLIYSGRINDWISSGKLLQNDKFCLVTGHLTAIELEYNRELQTCTIINKSFCFDKTTLYCSSILGKTWDDLIIFGGTAMNVIVFRPLSSNIIQRLSGNNGVTLSVDVSVEFNILITTSDDRSLKIYNFNIQEKIRDDYICNNPISTDSFIQSYGHTARVFQGKIIKKGNVPYILTVGEDSNLCVWNNKGQLLFRRLHHFGAAIWNLDYDYESGAVFTTGSDGNCKKYDLNSILSNISIQSKIETIDCLQTPSENSMKLDKFEKIAFLCNDRIVVGLTNQNFLMVKIGSETWVKIDHLLEKKTCQESLLKTKCSILKTYKNLIYLAAFKTLIIIEFDPVAHKFRIKKNEVVSNNYIKSIFFLNDDEYLVCDETGNCKLFNKNSNEYVAIAVPKSREPWVTCAFKFEEYFLLSNRQGNLFLYVYENSNFVLKNCLKHVNGNFGITNICLENDFKNFAILKTYGHDNTIKIIKLNKGLQNIAIISRQNIPIVWVERVFKFLEEEYIAGFNSTSFVVWNKKDGEVFSFNCGGGHRFWDCFINAIENTLKLIFIKKGSIHVVDTSFKNISKNLVNIIQYRWHMKECNVLKVINNEYLVSGGEDNILKISKLEKNVLQCERSLNVIQDMNQHISNIRTIEICHVSEDFLIFSAGGRAQICVSKFNTKTLFLEEVSTFMLRSTDFQKNNSNKGKIDFDPETRFMAMALLCNENNEIEIFSGCSDGYIRKFRFIYGNIKFVDGLFYNRCIMQVNIIKNKLLLSASTDGTINIWNTIDFSSHSKALYKIKHHESGINAIDIAEKDNHIYIITGGDDQSIVFSTIKYDNCTNFYLIKKTCFDFLHTAQVTGVKFTNDIKYFYSTSVDQTVCKFCLETNKLIENKSMCVADIKGLEILHENDKISGVVYGCGIESF
ncbi:uncharacterized protein LOC129618813 [Condylostylus longicornis]|uniref:uncharacterized protein LOC129618813 n=1 Tax=Condylostylus longicornis TaxID=2530218 RepID=UPI00244DE73F|nr:uncharacterized protein LOC129618813 [Condylostylus longicornis]